jgi:hypothetical protein
MTKNPAKTSTGKHGNELSSVSRVVSGISELSFNPEDVLFYHDSTSFDRRHVRILLDIGRSLTDKDFQGLPDDLTKEFGMDGGGQRVLSKKLSQGVVIEDLLGAYYPDTHTIVIYDVMCKIASRALDIDNPTLTRVVIAHEIVHAVTHLGKDSSGMMWKYFGQASDLDKELFAQVYSLLCLRHRKDKSGIDAFMRLSAYGDEIYESWRKYESVPAAVVNSALRWARVKTVGPGASNARELMDFMDSVREDITERVRRGTLDETPAWYYPDMIRHLRERILKEQGPASTDYYRERHEYLEDQLAEVEGLLGSGKKHRRGR